MRSQGRPSPQQARGDGQRAVRASGSEGGRGERIPLQRRELRRGEPCAQMAFSEVRLGPLTRSSSPAGPRGHGRGAEAARTLQGRARCREPGRQRPPGFDSGSPRGFPAPRSRPLALAFATRDDTAPQRRPKCLLSSGPHGHRGRRRRALARPPSPLIGCQVRLCSRRCLLIGRRRRAGALAGAPGGDFRAGRG